LQAVDIRLSGLRNACVIGKGGRGFCDCRNSEGLRDFDYRVLARDRLAFFPSIGIAQDFADNLVYAVVVDSGRGKEAARAVAFQDGICAERPGVYSVVRPVVCGNIAVACVRGESRAGDKAQEQDKC
jgi:hypothetical protein